MALRFNILKPYLLYSKFLFLFPHEDYWKVSDRWKIYTLVGYVCFVCIEIQGIAALLNEKIFNIYTSALIACSTSLDIVTIGIHVTNFVFKKEIVNSLLENIGHLYNTNNKRVSINANVWTLIAFIVCIYDLNNYLTIAVQNWAGGCFVIVPSIYLVMYTILMQFVYFLDFLKEEFQTLTNSIGNTETSLLKHVEEHWHLIELCHEVNQLYSKQLLLGLLRLFITLILDSFYVVNTYIKLRAYPDLYSILAPSISNFAWSLVMFTAITHTCDLTKETADRFLSALSDVLRKNQTLNNEKLVMYLHMKPTLHLTASGFFTLGRHAISSVLAAVLTNLVILIQVSENDKAFIEI